MAQVWTNDIRIGVDIIDQQHQTIFQKTKALNDALKTDSEDSAAVLQMLEFLNAYIKYHFSMEESLMKDVGYPNYEMHKAQHMKFCEKIKWLEQEYANSGYLNVYAINIYNAVTDWIFRHISIEDKRISPHVKGHRNIN